MFSPNSDGACPHCNGAGVVYVDLGMMQGVDVPCEVCAGKRFNEPTTGLHLTDTARLVDLFNRLVDTGSTVIVVEHNLASVSRADYVIDLGPGAGSAGGRVVAEGTVREVVDTHERTGFETGRYLAYAADL